MSKLQKEWIEDNAVDGSKFKLLNDQYLKGRNAANNADVNLAKINSSDQIEFGSAPYVGSDKVQTAADKGVNNGLATLDAGGKIPAAQLPNSVMDYKGSWNANTNSPSLADGSGSAGDVYLVSTAGSQDLGSGSISFAQGDWVVYNGSIWEKSINSNAVVSVNSQTGVVSLDSDDISEGSSNLYFTEARVRGSVLTGYSSGAGTVAATDTVLQAINKLNGNTALKLDSSAFTDTAVTGKLLTGFSAGAGTVADTDSILQAFNKIVGNINALDGADAEYEIKTLNGTDITNQYVDLAAVAMTDSIIISPKGGLVQEPGVDYTLSYTGGSGGNTRVTFAGDLASTLIAGHKLMIKYLKA